MKKWIFFTFILLNSSYSQEAQVPCINKNGDFDLSCTCAKKKNCLSAMSKSEKAGIKKLNEEVRGGYVMKITKMALPAYKEMKNTFNGKFDVEKFPYKKLKEQGEKLEKINNKLNAKVEKIYKELGIKPYKISERVKMREKIFKKQLGKKNMQMIESGQYKLNIGSLVEGSYNPAAASSSQAPTSKSIASQNKPQKDQTEEELDKIDNILKSGSENDIKVRDTSKKRFTDAELIAAAKKRFKIFTVRKKDEGSLFEFISQAFRKNIKNLDQRAIARGGSDRQLDVIETQKRNLIKRSTSNFLRNSY